MTFLGLRRGHLGSSLHTSVSERATQERSSSIALLLTTYCTRLLFDLVDWVSSHGAMAPSSPTMTTHPQWTRQCTEGTQPDSAYALSAARGSESKISFVSNLKLLSSIVNSRDCLYAKLINIALWVQQALTHLHMLRLDLLGIIFSSFLCVALLV